MNGLEAFVEFSRYEKLAGGPDPQIAMAVKYGERLLRDQDRWWFGGCYIGVYNYPSAERIDAVWSLNDVLSGGQAELTSWLASRWAGIETRRERRSVRSAAKLGRFLYEYAEWVDRTLDLERGDVLWSDDPFGNYEMLWADCQHVYTLGRYVAIKLLEYLRRSVGAPLAQPDLRLLGGWSPMEGLALIWPDHAEELDRGDVSAPLGEELGKRLAQEAGERGVELNVFEMQVLLCEFKQMVNGRQYPGRSHDSEMDYEEKILDYWGKPTHMSEYRTALFPKWALGEHGGWSGVRKPLTQFYETTGQVWTDSAYRYPDDLPAELRT